MKEASEGEMAGVFRLHLKTKLFLEDFIGEVNTHIRCQLVLL